MREPESSLSVQRNVLNERGTLKSEGTQDQESIPLLCSTGKVFVLRPQWVCEFPVFPTQKNNEPVVYYVSIKWELYRKVDEKRYMSVGVMKDLKLKIRDLHVSHTLCWNHTHLPKKSIIIYFLRTVSVWWKTKREHYCLLWIDEARAKDKTYMSVGVMKD